LKYLLILFFTLNLNAATFTKEKLIGTWELSSEKINSTVSFGSHIGKKRNEIIILKFSRNGILKTNLNQTFNYEVKNGTFVIYKTKIYKNDFRVKNKNRYDQLKIIGTKEDCYKVKVIKKKIPGYKSKNNYKMCKVENYPIRVTNY